MNRKNITVIILLVSVIIIFAVFKNYSFTLNNKIYSIVLTNEGFSPSELSIQKGGTVIFTATTGEDFWPASDLHPTHGIYPDFDPRQPILADDPWSFEFNKEGSWRFHDHLNSLHTGVIEVSNKSKINEESCSTSGGQIKCWQELLNNTLEEKGLPATFDLLADLYTKEPLFALECHSFVHEIGRNTYRKFQSEENFELNSKTSYCGYGFYHGFMETLLYTIGDVKQAQDFCKYVGVKLAGETTDGEGACYHGIGHGAVDGGDPTSWGDPQKMLAPGFDMCLKVAGDDTREYGKLYRCITGAYNALEILSMDSKYKLLVIEKDPFSICPSQPEEYKEGCYTNMLPALLRLTQNDLLKSQKYIEEIPENHSNFSIRGPVTSSLFHEFVRFHLNEVDYNKREGIKMCHSLGDSYRKFCIEGLSGGHMKYGDPNVAYVKGLAFCASAELRDDEEDICYNSILSRLRIWYSERKSAEICESVPDKFQKYCKTP